MLKNHLHRNTMVIGLAIFHAIRQIYSLSIFISTILFLLYLFICWTIIDVILKRKKLKDRKIKPIFKWGFLLLSFSILIYIYNTYP